MNRIKLSVPVCICCVCVRIKNKEIGIAFEMRFDSSAIGSNPRKRTDRRNA